MRSKVPGIAMLESLRRVVRRGGGLRNLLVSAGIVLLTACSLPSEEAGSPVKPAPSATPNPPSEAQVRAAQEALARLGFYPGPIDGISGPKTRAAVMNYQTDVGLPPDGEVSPELVARLEQAHAPTNDIARAEPGEPTYEAGDAYVYTDGQIETVVSVDELRVEWKNAAGSRWSSALDFPLPSSETDHGAIIMHRPLAWPLKVGATATYSVTAATANPGDPGREESELWRCIVDSRQRTAVAAGTFDTYKIVCRRPTGASGTVHARSWYYAPAIGTYVRYVDDPASSSKDRTGQRSRDLIAISPSVSGWPSEARIGLEWAVSHALEIEPDGQPVPWESSAIPERFVIESGPRLDSKNPGQCRQFTQTRTAGDGTRRLYPGAACRSADGRWHLMGLDGAPGGETGSTSSS